MGRNNKTTAAILCSLLFAAVVSFTAFTVPVWAEDSGGDPVDIKTLSLKAAESEEEIEGQGVHADPKTFEKNFCLSPAQKEYTITEIEKVVSLYTEPEMSDLQKYYTLAKWANQRVVYDNDFWSGAYNFDYYSHQWDAYGCMKEDEKSVCAGIAIFYSNLCHAADLPCKFVRLDPKDLDHTISYIPDINGNAYYADITENAFLMSKEACVFADDVDKGFAQITKDPTDGTFEFKNKYDSFQGTDIKGCWQNKVSYKDWFREYALHEGTNKKFMTDYGEKGSGTYGTHYASYHNFGEYPAQTYESRTSAVTGIWFLDDFYMEPSEAKAKILNKELDEQFLNISGVEENYDCNTPEDLAAAVNDHISVRYFPSVDENGEIAAKAARLANGTDYTVTCTAFDELNGEAEIAIEGTGNYSGTYLIRVRLYSAVARKAPTRINGLTYNEGPHALVEPGEAEHGTMVYAACKAGDPEPEDYTETVPAETNIGKYDVWYKVIGDEGYRDTPAQKLERAVKIAGQDISDKVGLSKTAFTYNGKVQKPSIKATSGKDLKAGTDYKATWSNAKSKDADAYYVTIEGKGNYSGTVWLVYKIKKAANPMKLKGRTAEVKYSKVRKKAQTIERAKVITVSKKKGSTSYKLVFAKKDRKSFKKKFKINARTGKVTVKKGLKKGTYRVKVRVRAAGNSNYKASSWKAVMFKVRVK